eukprot:scaffold147475_cov19-Tisochrysis_lutea.AAC.5
MVPPALAGKAQAMGGRDPETRKKRTADSLYLPTRLVYLRQKGTARLQSCEVVLLEERAPRCLASEAS